MGFLNGRVTYTRFRVSGDSPLPFGEDHLELIDQNAIGKRGSADPTDGISTGWAGGDHVLDVSFDLSKNLINDALHLAMRVDTDKIPSSLLNAYTRIETDARAKNNPSGFPTKAQRTEAKEAARIRAEAESSDGRFRRLAHSPILWDGQTNVLYAGITSVSVLDRLLTLFRETFDRTLEPITAGSLAQEQAAARGDTRLVEEFGPVGFVGEDASYSSIAWSGADASRPDFWGNEFLLWLWHTLQADTDTIVLPDGSEITVMVAKTLTLDCPRGETGRDCLTNEGPTRLPEAFRALRGGQASAQGRPDRRPPRPAIRVDHPGRDPRRLGANLPKIEGASGREIQVARVDGLRHLVETLDLLYDAYGRRRLGPDWTNDLGRIRRWLQAA